MSRLKTRAAGLATIAVLGGAALVPAAAAANAAPAFTSACVAHKTSPLKTCTATVAIGHSRNRIVVTTSNAKGKSTVNIFIHGVGHFTVKAQTNGKSFFTSHQLPTGRYYVQVQGTSQNGKPFHASNHIRITGKDEPAAFKGSATGGSAALVSAAGPAAATQPSGGLAFTGAEIGAMSLLGLGLVGGGGTLVLASRRRRAA